MPMAAAFSRRYLRDATTSINLQRWLFPFSCPFLHSLAEAMGIDCAPGGGKGAPETTNAISANGEDPLEENDEGFYEEEEDAATAV